LNRQAAKRTKIFNHKGHEGHEGKTRIEIEPPRPPSTPRRTRTNIEPQANADREVLSLGRFLVSASERQFPVAPVPAQRADALEGSHTAAQNAAL
jgi:hypothetical protein